MAFPSSIAVISSPVDLRESIRLLLLLQYRQRRVECAPRPSISSLQMASIYYTRPVQPSRHRRFRQKIEKFEEGFISDPPCTTPVGGSYLVLLFFRQCILSVHYAPFSASKEEEGAPFPQDNLLYYGTITIAPNPEQLLRS